jgi:LAO/AO transport system kinase
MSGGINLALNVEKTVEQMLSQNELALSRLMSIVERGDPLTHFILREISPYVGKSLSIGITGAPGAGKSTLTDRLTAQFRSQNKTVGIIAVDPSSPFTGGAILGDRVRMEDHYQDHGVFIRSMATRRAHGGLAQTTSDMISLLDAFGKDVIIVETVGVGQNELDVMNTVDLVVVALVPEGGDSIQMMKAGLMEIADIFVVNKSDREGAKQTVIDLDTTLRVKEMILPHGETKEDQWQVPVIATQAHLDIGIVELCNKISAFENFLNKSGLLHKRRSQRRRDKLVKLVENKIKHLIFGPNSNLKDIIAKVESGEVDPYQASEQLISYITHPS